MMALNQLDLPALIVPDSLRHITLSRTSPRAHSPASKWAALGRYTNRPDR
jgi:hypothetical protein